MIRKYNEFLLKKILEGQLYGSSNFIEKLEELSNLSDKISEISQLILDFIESEYEIDDKLIKQNFFDTTDKERMLSFIMNNKIPKNFDITEEPALPYMSTGRGEISVGKAIRYILTITNKMHNFSDKDIEDFVNAYKGIQLSDKFQFKFVSGDDIVNYYDTSNYYKTNGSLGSSCMGDEDSNVFKIYTKNNVRLLILVNEDDQICGRALVWELDSSPCDAKFFMDRAYTNMDSDVYKFKKFADENGFLHKQKMNSYNEDNVKFTYKGAPVYGQIKVKVKGDFMEYPFIDTLCFLSKNLKTLSNLPSKGSYFLQSLFGSCEHCDECLGECYTNDDEICSTCGEGHTFLKEKGIETKINSKIQ